MKTKPPTRVIINIALGIVFSGFSVSSENVDAESNPRKEKHNKEAPAITKENDSVGLKNGKLVKFSG